MDAENREVYQSLAIVRKEDGIDVWQRWTCLEDVGDMLDILANEAIEELEEDLLVRVQRMEAREAQGQKGCV